MNGAQSRASVTARGGQTSHMSEEAFRSILRRAFDEYYVGLTKALSGLTVDERRFQASAEANHIDFIAWHMARNEDGTVSACARAREVWQRDGWFHRLGLPESGDGCGFTVEEMRLLPRIEIDALLEYFSAVRSETERFLAALGTRDLARPVFDDRPEVTIGQILSHLVVEQAQHLGQVAFIRGLQRGAEFTTSWNNPDTASPG